MSYNGIFPKSNYSFTDTHLTSHNINLTNPLPVQDKDKQLNQRVFRIETPPATPSENLLISEALNLKQFYCNFETGGNFINKVDFIDASSVPLTGTEENKFGIIISENLKEHNINFPDNGIYFQHGLVIKCSNISGTPNIDAVNATGVYTLKSDEILLEESNKDLRQRIVYLETVIAAHSLSLYGE